jgi:glycosyltransferase involved in cell wall biosynthesis
MSVPLISVALCTYNGAAFLRAQLDSILQQDYPQIEIVAVDDASTDATLPLLRDYAARHPRMTVHVNERNLGFRRNFERALGLCRGELIAPCDQDDLWLPQKLSRLAGALGDRVLVYGDSAIVDASGAPTGRRVSDRFRMYQGMDPRVFTFQNCISGHAMLFRRELLERSLPLPEGVYHDWWLAFIAAGAGGIRYVDECLVRFRQHAAASSGFTRAGPARPRKTPTQRYADESRELDALRRHAPAPYRAFYDELWRLWQQRAGARWSPALFGFLARHSRVLYALRRGPGALKWRHAVKHLRGARAAAVAPA